MLQLKSSSFKINHKEKREREKTYKIAGIKGLLEQQRKYTLKWIHLNLYNQLNTSCITTFSSKQLNLRPKKCVKQRYHRHDHHHHQHRHQQQQQQQKMVWIVRSVLMITV